MPEDLPKPNSSLKELEKTNKLIDKNWVFTCFMLI
jgi:hypothetical protein